MPIYAYRCTSCGHAQDVLQKMSDPVLTVCPACGAASYAKQVTAAGFQLKGSGWYVTDFRGGSKPEGDAAKTAEKSGDKPNTTPAKPATDAKPSAAPAPAAAPAAAAPAPSTSTGSGSGASSS
jgi:putative FmdB family regulatory protein